MEYCILSDKINPFVRYSGFVSITDTFSNSLAYARDCRLFYFLRGTGFFVADDVEYRIQENDVFLLPPMTSYTIREPICLEFYLINFDYLSENVDIEKALPVLHSANGTPLQNVIFQDIPELNSPLRINIAGLEPFFTKMIEQYVNKKKYYFREMSAYFSLVITQIFKKINNDNLNNKVVEIKKYVDEHFSENLSNKEIAEHFHYHPNYLNRLFVRYLGISLHQYLLNLRIDKAVIMLQSGMYTVTQVAKKAGYKNISQFSAHFKHATGYCPSSIVYKKDSV